MDAEILLEASQQILADRVALRCIQELCPNSSELVVRDRRERRIRQSSPANARSFFEVPCFHVAAIEIKKVQKGILVELVLDISLHHLLKESLGLRLESKRIQQLSTGEPAANA